MNDSYVLVIFNKIETIQPTSVVQPIPEQKTLMDWLFLMNQYHTAEPV